MIALPTPHKPITELERRRIRAVRWMQEQRIKTLPERKGNSPAEKWNDKRGKV